MATQAMKRASAADVLRTVLAAALGVRRRAAHERDTARIHPLQLVIAGLIAAALFVAALVAFIRYVVLA